jgi:hypothetical protein
MVEPKKYTIKLKEDLDEVTIVTNNGSITLVNVEIQKGIHKLRYTEDTTDFIKRIELELLMNIYENDKFWEEPLEVLGQEIDKRS